ncbi:MAG: electron transfer flavoprotein subunit alpha/FixB family protein, partial [Gammaproteobacteria bacterium]|nr:electron transfer flavoprotein subunit alpha/FixB family protein [Gammaproteobacteria bacterium]
MGILVIAEHDNHAIRGATLNTIGAAVQLGDDVTLLVAGSNCGAAAAGGAGIVGVSRVLHADAPHYEYGLAEELAPLVAAATEGMTHVLAPANTFGKNLMPRVAALLDVGMIAD